MRAACASWVGTHGRCTLDREDVNHHSRSSPRISENSLPKLRLAGLVAWWGRGGVYLMGKGSIDSKEQDILGHE